jgi:hypothetical protein
VSFRKGGPYKPKVKSGAAQRESERIVVLTMGTTNNAFGGRVPAVGAPEPGVISRSLSNIYLHVLDTE